MRAGRLAAVVAASALVMSLTGCESAEEKKAESALKQTADMSTCQGDAKPVGRPFAGGFPRGFTFPPRTTVYHVEDRGAAGVIATGISSAPFASVLHYLNHDAVAAGFKITEGETEEHDAEANWAGNGYRGRWAIRESAQCSGQTVVQVLASKTR